MGAGRILKLVPVTSNGISHYCEDVHKTAYELNQWEVNHIDTLSRRVGDSKAMVQSVTERVDAYMAQSWSEIKLDKYDHKVGGRYRTAFGYA
jgi:hypothetical protein